MSTADRRDGWRKSSLSDTGNGCVEVFRTLGALRDSKQPGGPELVADVPGLVGMVKGGRLDS
ncbi:DUF397 domain-containing protein [Actinophytocola gossypii]|uniref:DUF397 domain-containing protein n=1 Tax=Actinophytocola gossypii TaxID=2812003 RepID=A0ABT2J8G2_9PSEU|nr:DUF397 domain-containing protein [Actinophytocola gossypii]MCT2584150.1 DUF397 domain-containing protein [Actinophytocola gossypii]